MYLPASTTQCLLAESVLLATLQKIPHLVLANDAGKWPAAREPTDINTIWNQTSLLLPLLVVGFVKLCKAKLARDVDLLPTGELELCAAACLHTNSCLLLLGADG